MLSKCLSTTNINLIIFSRNVKYVPHLTFASPRCIYIILQSRKGYKGSKSPVCRIKPHFLVWFNNFMENGLRLTVGNFFFVRPLVFNSKTFHFSLITDLLNYERHFSSSWLRLFILYWVSNIFRLLITYICTKLLYPILYNFC